MKTITTKQIRQDLQGFLRRLQQGEQLTVLYRTRPIVSVGTVRPTEDQIEHPGSPAAIRRSIALAAAMRTSSKYSLDPHKSVKQLYGETLNP